MKMLQFNILVIFGVFTSLVNSASVYKESSSIIEAKRDNEIFDKTGDNNSKIVIRAKRNREIFDETFLPGNAVQLSVPSIAQTLGFTCGPTFVLAMLRFWGFRGLANDIPGPISGNLCADGLILSMQTDPYDRIYGGTQIPNFVNTINNRILNGNFNSLRQYMAIPLNPSILNMNGLNHQINYENHYLRLARNIFNSLVNRAPVALGFRGRFNGFEQRRDHFILISGVTITDNGVTFNYMDPDGGHQRSFTQHNLNHLLENGGVLVYHRPVPSGPGSSESNRNCPRAAAYGATAGMTGGLLAGAAVGSAVPIVGTLFGGLAGGITGFVLGTTSSAAACVL